LNQIHGPVGIASVSRIKHCHGLHPPIMYTTELAKHTAPDELNKLVPSVKVISCNLASSGSTSRLRVICVRGAGSRGSVLASFVGRCALLPTYIPAASDRFVLLMPPRSESALNYCRTGSYLPKHRDCHLRNDGISVWSSENPDIDPTCSQNFFLPECDPSCAIRMYQKSMALFLLCDAIVRCQCRACTYTHGWVCVYRTLSCTRI